MAKKPSNPYKLQPIARAVEAPAAKVVERPRPSVEAGQLATGSYRPLLFTIPYPAPVLAVIENSRFVSGWAVRVDTSEGIKDLDSGYFSPYTNPA